VSASVLVSIVYIVYASVAGVFIVVLGRLLFVVSVSMGVVGDVLDAVGEFRCVLDVLSSCSNVAVTFVIVTGSFGSSICESVVIVGGAVSVVVVGGAVSVVVVGGAVSVVIVGASELVFDVMAVVVIVPVVVTDAADVVGDDPVVLCFNTNDTKRYNIFRFPV
jgi:hypothetical protein